MESERRRSSRCPFFAPAELTESTSGARLEAATSDLSSNGCYQIRLVRYRRALSSAFNYLSRAGLRGWSRGCAFASEHGDGRELYCLRIGLRVHT